MTLIVNFFAGPGVGKSTTAAAVFAELKRRHVNAELVTEYAKDLVWEGVGHLSFEYPIAYFAEQHRRFARLAGKVDVIITDSPLLFCLVYQKWSPEFEALVLAEHRRWPTFNVVLNRIPGSYQAAGRLQADEAAAIELDEKIEDMLRQHDIFHEHYEITPGLEAALADWVQQIEGSKAC